MYKDTSYLGSKLRQVTFSKRNKPCSFRFVEHSIKYNLKKVKRKLQ